MTQILTVSLITLLLEHLIRLKLRRKPDEEPEAIQGKPVDRVLYHLVTDAQCPWDAGESWEKHGRGHIVALERQGLDDLLDERAVEDYKAAYTLGYCVREQEDKAEIERLTKQLQRRDETIKRQGERIDDLKEQLRRKPEPEPVHVAEREQRPKDPLQEAWEEWGASPDGIDTIMQRKGWQRIGATTAESVTVEPVTVAEPEEVTDHTQSEEPTTDYKDLKGDERKQTMMELRDSGLSNAEIGVLFGVSAGCVKSTISVYRKQLAAEQDEPKPKVIPLNFDGLKAVNDR